ncbi:SDR family NAD(P)-dependent oxidoreductase [Alteribacillus sp. YIM 98480]|uniref:SDR family NAD(P)-dependent oxidoreductase n=1 Tax=Alteribacillus sp. YIM 98480 TaxID=2606599 RepID=UPI00131BC578|nr:SDR family oxidoreductase [Alteribacillus sp. YIM 98480]
MHNKTVLITGGGKGLGREIAKRFAACHYQVFINYNKDLKAAKITEHAINEDGGSAEIIQADVSKEEDIDRMMKELPGIDILIHNAVYAKSNKPESISIEQWKKSLQVNASALLFLSQKTFSHMKQNGYGRIFGISSSGSSKGIPSYMSVGVAKAALESIVRYLTVEWGKYGITANTVSPGAMDTEAFRSVFADADKRLDYIGSRSPKKRTVQKQEVADLLIHLCKEEMEMVAGQNIIVDGGYSIKG